MRITREHPLQGEALTDVTGEWFLAPEEDYRGGGMGSIRLEFEASDTRRCAGAVVWATGIFDTGTGLLVDDMGEVREEAEGQDRNAAGPG